jgi:hypothetical protein
LIDRIILFGIRKCQWILPSTVFMILETIFEKEHLDQECLSLILIFLSQSPSLTRPTKILHNIFGKTPFLAPVKFLIGLSIQI